MIVFGLGYEFAQNNPSLKNEVAYPCGFIAQSMFYGSNNFNIDTFKIRNNGGNIKIEETDITWSEEKSYYKNINMPGSWTNMEDGICYIILEHFIVWMKLSGLPSFRKHWGRIEQDLEPGEYTITIENKYDISQFSGKKYIVLSTTNAFGGKNNILGGLFIGIACLGAIFCIVFIVAYKLKQKNQFVGYTGSNQS